MELETMIEIIEDYIVKYDIPCGGTILICATWHDELKEHCAIYAENGQFTDCLVYEGRLIKKDDSLNENEISHE